MAQSMAKSASLPLKQMELRAHMESVKDYSESILYHYLDLENETRPTPKMILAQPEIRPKMRPLLLDYVLEVVTKLRLSSSTFLLSVNLIDRYSSLRIVRKQHYQLLGLSALWTAAKYNEKKSRIPSISDLVKLCRGCYAKKLFLEMESHILKTLKWSIGFPSHDCFLDVLLKEQKSTVHNLSDLKSGAVYLCELAEFHPKVCFSYPPSSIAAASVIVTNETLNAAKFGSDPNTRFDELSALLVEIAACPSPALKTRYAGNKVVGSLVAFTRRMASPSLPVTPISRNSSPTWTNAGVSPPVYVQPISPFQERIQERSGSMCSLTSSSTLSSCDSFERKRQISAVEGEAKRMHSQDLRFPQDARVPHDVTLANLS